MQHPLSFFVDLAQRDLIDNLKNTFFENAEGDPTNQQFDKKEEWALYQEENGEQICVRKVFFNDHLNYVFSEQKSLAIQAVDFHIIDLADAKKIPNLLLAYITTLEQSLLKIAANSKYVCYKEVTEVYNDLIEYLKGKANSLGLMINAKGRNPNEKNMLQWNDKTKTLTTLFFDLYERNLNNGKPYITSQSKQAVIDFIVGNFIDEQGNELSSDTIKGYLKPGRLSARANNGKAIDIVEILNNSEGH